jgi:hypothetical protein
MRSFADPDAFGAGWAFLLSTKTLPSRSSTCQQVSGLSAGAAIASPVSRLKCA